ncbi:hypothetical protein Dimus_038958 [Dionaea muscipula]
MGPRKQPKLKAPASLPVPDNMRSGRRGNPTCSSCRKHQRSKPRLSSPISGFRSHTRRVEGHGARNPPIVVKTLLRGMTPQATLQIKPLKKRMSGKYTPSYPVLHFKSPDYMCTSPAPVLNNIPHPERSIMTCEDNALAAIHAVATATQGDLNHYINEHGLYEKDWINKDMRTAIALLSMHTRGILESAVIELKIGSMTRTRHPNMQIIQIALREMSRSFSGIADKATARCLESSGGGGKG